MTLLTCAGSCAPAAVPLDASVQDANAEGCIGVPRQEATLSVPGTDLDGFGWSVALSADGSRALVGDIGDAASTVAGNAFVFSRAGTTWAWEATLLTPTTGSNGLFGHSVALSVDGSRALVGAPFDPNARIPGAGTARVFLRTGSAWAEEATLLAPDGAAGDAFGWSVALSSDGSRALVGAQRDTTGVAGGNEGSARVFLRTATTWAQEAVLLATDGGTADYFGCSVALSADGVRALVGVNADDTADGVDAGSARVFVRAGTTWTAETTLVASGRPASAYDFYLGASVALSSDGSRALVGGWRGDSEPMPGGSARVFVRAGTTWTEEPTLVGSGAPSFGRSVAFSADGRRALVGAPGAYSARFFVSTGVMWSEAPPLLAPDDAFGWSVSLSADGCRALVGGRDSVAHIFRL